MDLEFRQFGKEHFVEYASWFADPDLNRQLGPMDEAWLELVMRGGEVSGDETWAVLCDGQLVAVVEALVDSEHPASYTIGAVATNPVLRRQGIGTRSLQHVLDLHKSRGIVEHSARVSVDNWAGRRCAAKSGFEPVSSVPDEHGYLELRRRQGRRP
jgi:GNAT superfamily N-acetyltransferase